MRPLIAIANQAGGEWPSRVRQAALALSGVEEADDSEGVQLLGDIREVFTARDGSRLKSNDLLFDLNHEDRRWQEWNRGKGLTPYPLARLLREFGIKPRKLRFSTEKTAQGYELSAFAEAFRRYLPDPPSQTGTPEQFSNDAGLDANQTGTQDARVPASQSANPSESGHCSGVPIRGDGSQAGAGEEPFRS